MVAKTPLDPARLRETLVKVDKCIARLQESQSTVAGVGKVGGGMSLSPRMSSRANRLRTSLRCKQNNTQSRSPKGKFPTSSAGGEWRRMFLTGMLVGETMAEILQASKFAGDAAVADKGGKRFRDDPRSSPITPCKSQRLVRGKAAISEEKKSRKTEQIEIIVSLFSCSPECMFSCGDHFRSRGWPTD